ncbi:MAG: hypothetical protein EOO44_21285 [Flavobacterium sp.]|nr:MAG: hypothetical protein EOO44_21285 [Flavobacterium sp.]
MQNSHKKNKKLRDKKPLYILAGAIAFFGIFVYLITRPSIQNIALKELETSYNKKDVETVWYKYKAELSEDEEFLNATRSKLSSFKLSDDDLRYCQGWLPPAPTSINIVVIPDLSGRINDNINNPDQVGNDKLVLKTIWQSFINVSKLKQDSKDKFIVDVTDISQAKGQFGKVANQLQFDLSTHKGKSNLLYFTDGKNKEFEKGINTMYDSAKAKPLGADYVFYLRRYLNSRLKKSTLFDNYLNKVLIVTDGYLEATGRSPDTKIYGFEKVLYPAVTFGNILSIINLKQLNIPAVSVDLSNTQILICEVNERKKGKGKDFEILEVYWKDWMTKMGLKSENFKFIPREQASNITENYIKNFIEN